MLRYSAAFFALDGSGLANNEPQVIMRGGHLRKLVIYLDQAAPRNGVWTSQEIPLTEVRGLDWSGINAWTLSKIDWKVVVLHFPKEMALKVGLCVLELREIKRKLKTEVGV